MIVMSFIIRYRYAVAAGLAVIILAFSAWQAYSRIYAKGYDACVAAVAEAKHKADEETRERQKPIRKKTEGQEHEIKKENGGKDRAHSYVRNGFRVMRTDD